MRRAGSSAPHSPDTSVTTTSSTKELATHRLKKILRSWVVKFCLYTFRLEAATFEFVINEFGYLNLSCNDYFRT